MKIRSSNFLWGLAFIIVGVCYAGDAFHLWNFDLFFDGWWTLFLIIPCLYGILVNGFGMGKFIGLVIGIGLLLSEQRIISSRLIDNLIFPIILVLIGINILNSGKYKERKEIEGSDDININSDTNKNEYKYDKKVKLGYTAIFSGIEEKISNEEFNGTGILAAFGSVDLDLKDSYITHNINIKSFCMFGSVDLIVPSDIRVEVTSIPIFGGTSNTTQAPINRDSPVIYVDSICIFGGVDIKN